MTVWVVSSPSGEMSYVDVVYASLKAAVEGTKAKALYHQPFVDSWDDPIRHDSHGECWTLRGYAQNDKAQTVLYKIEPFHVEGENA